MLTHVERLRRLMTRRGWAPSSRLPGSTWPISRS